MKRKIINHTSISLALLLIVSVLVLFKSGKLEKQAETAAYFSSEINNFCIDDLCLNKRESGWFMDYGTLSLPAESENIEATVKRLNDIKLVEIVSQNREKFASMGIKEGEEATILKTQNKSLEIGNVNQSYSGTFVREENGDKVYVIGMVLDKTNLKSPEYWQLKNITNLPLYQIKKITVKSDDAISREILPDDDGKWKDEKAVEKVAHLQAINFHEVIKDAAVDYEFIVDTEDGSHNFYLKRQDNGRRVYKYLSSKDKEYFFEISKEDFDSLTGILK